MGKSAVILGVSAGGSALAVGGNYVMGNFSSDDKLENLSPSISVPILPQTVDDLKNGEDESCWREYFPGFDFNGWEIDESNRSAKALDKYRKPGNKLETSFFKKTDDSTPRSCLTVNGRKENYDQSKGTGDFSWLGAFVRGNHGFIGFSIIQTTGKDSIPLELSGGIYFLKKLGEEGTLYKYKEGKSTTTFSEKITSQNFKDKFPSVGTAITKDEEFGSEENSKNHWGFLSGASDLNNICKISDSTQCGEATSNDFFGGMWEWEMEDNGDNKKIIDGSNNSKRGLSDLYNDAYTIGTVSSFLDQIQGKWVKKSLHSSKGGSRKLE